MITVLVFSDPELESFQNGAGKAEAMELEHCIAPASHVSHMKSPCPDRSAVRLPPSCISKASNSKMVTNCMANLTVVPENSNGHYFSPPIWLSWVSNSPRIIGNSCLTLRSSNSTSRGFSGISIPRGVSRASYCLRDTGDFISPWEDDGQASAACINATSRIVRRRKMLELCIYFGLFSFGSQHDVQAAALGGDVRVPQDVGLENGRLRSCEGAAPCVSTSAFRSPSRFMPPWEYLGSQADAYGALLKALNRMGAEIMKTDDGRYVYATMSTSSSKEDTDDLEFLFVGKVVCFRSLSRKVALDPPFCWWAGCINGPRNRGRMEALRDDLGWTPLETDEDKTWTPIFLH